VEFQIRHPRDPTWLATYGVDFERGCWAEVPCNGVIVVHDGFEVGFDDERPVWSVLRFLSTFGFVDGADAEAALDWLEEEKSHRENFWAGPPPWPDRRHRPSRRGLRRLLKVIRDLEDSSE
jgi:hypothetical protein